MTTTTIGRIVLYALSQHEADAINKRRKDAYTSKIAHRNEGSVVHFGNEVEEGEVFPMIITRVWPRSGLVNGQVLLDGNDTFWATSIYHADEIAVGCYTWPERS